MTQLSLLRGLVENIKSIASVDDDWWDFGRDVKVNYESAQSTPTAFVFATKKCWIEALGGTNSESLGVFVRPGLLLPSHARFISEKMGGARNIFFLGDADPFDLTLFCSLRIRMAQISPSFSIKFGGVGDDLVELSNRYLSVRYYPSIPLKRFEVNHWRLLCDAFPTLPVEIGVQTASLLRAGKKVESEAITNMLFYDDDYGAALRQALLLRLRSLSK